MEPLNTPQQSRSESAVNMLSTLVGLALLVPDLAVLVRRLHDTGRSAWWVALILVPILGLLILLLVTLRDSQDRPNRWGPPPPGSSYADPATWAAAHIDGSPVQPARVHPARKWAGVAIATAVGAAILLAPVGWLSSLVVLVLPDQRIERPKEGFAISLPSGWEYVVGAEADPDEWWSSDTGDPGEHHEVFLADGGILLARQATSRGLDYCYVIDRTAMASASASTALSDAVEDYMVWKDDAELVEIDTGYLDLPAGRVARIDSRWENGWDQRDYVFKDGETWFLLQCNSTLAPEDRWMPIAETFEFLPVEEADPAHDANTVLDALREDAEPSGP